MPTDPVIHMSMDETYDEADRKFWPKKLVGTIPLSQETVDDIFPRNPNYCDPWTNTPCWIHTRLSWGCLYNGPCYVLYHEVGTTCPNPGCPTRTEQEVPCEACDGTGYTRG